MEEYVNVRKCNICGEFKKLEDYVIGKENAGGRRPTCKACFSRIMKERRKQLSTKEEKELYTLVEEIAILITHDYTVMEAFKIIRTKL